MTIQELDNKLKANKKICSGGDCQYEFRANGIYYFTKDFKNYGVLTNNNNDLKLLSRNILSKQLQKAIEPINTNKPNSTNPNKQNPDKTENNLSPIFLIAGGILLFMLIKK